MTDLVITASQIQPDTKGTIERGIAGVAVTAGQTVYLDTSTNTYKLADANASAATATVKGIALHAASPNQPLAVQTAGSPVLGAGAAPVIGTVYVQSGTAGGIAPVADLVTGWRATVLGVGAAGNKLAMGVLNSGQAVP